MQNILSGTEKNLIRKLHESEYFIEQVVNYSPDIIYVLDLVRNKFTFTSKRAEEIMGPDNLRMDKIHPFDYTPRLDHISSCLQLKKSESKDIQLRMKVKNGQWNWFQVRDIAFMFDEQGYATHTMGFVRDIHSEKLKEDNLVHDQSLLKGLVNSPNIGIVIYKAIRNTNKEIIDFEFVLTTKAFEEFHDRKDLIGKWAFEEFPEIKALQYENWKKIVDNNEPASVITSYPNPLTGNMHWFSLKYEKFGDGFMLSWEDITEMRTAKNELTAAQDMLNAVFNASPVKITVMKAVRNASSHIIDFEYTMCNHDRHITGKRLSDVYPKLSGTLISQFRKVVESEKPVQWQEHLKGDEIDSLYFINVVKLNDGVVSTSVDLYENYPQAHADREQIEACPLQFF